MLRIMLIMGLAACGATSPTNEASEPADPSRLSQGRCLPVVGHCGCSYACGRSDGVAANGNVLVRTARDAEPVEAQLESWCQPEGECRDAFVRPLPCGGECVPTRSFDRCHFDGPNCVQAHTDVFRSEADDWLSEIAVRQEVYRSVFGQYFPQTEPPIGWTPAELSDGPVRWEATGPWSELRFRSGERTSLQFRLWAGHPDTDPPVPAPPRIARDAEGDGYWLEGAYDHDYWYVARARGRVGGELVTVQRVSWNAGTTIVDALPE